jgi:hypothetical protein
LGGAAASTSLSTFTTETTFPNGGPTQTYLTVSTAIINGGGINNAPSVTTYVTSTTFPNGGPTQTYLTASTLFNNNGGAFTTTYSTATTFPDGGPTETYLLTSTGFNNCNSVGLNGVIGCATSYPSGLIFSTGFQGERTSTSTGPTTFQTYSTAPDGQIRTYQTSSLTTATLTISGVSAITRTTYSTTSVGTTTGTSFVNGQLFTFTNTFTSTGLVSATRPAFLTSGAGKKQVGGESLLEKAIIGLAGIALAYL